MPSALVSGGGRSALAVFLLVAGFSAACDRSPSATSSRTDGSAGRDAAENGGSTGPAGAGGNGGSAGKAGAVPTGGAGNGGATPIGGTSGDTGVAGSGGNVGPTAVPPIVDGPASGTLQILAGQLGGLGTLDGGGADARFRFIDSMAVDDTDRRLFVIEGYCCTVPPTRSLRAIDLDTARVTTVLQLGSSMQVLYQRGYLYIPGPDGIAKISATSGVLTGTLPLPPIEWVTDHPILPWAGCYVAAPDGDSLYYPCGTSLVRIDSATGSSTAIPYLGPRPSGYNPAVAMPSQNSILLADNNNSLTTPIEQLLQIDVSSGAVSIALDYSTGFANTAVSFFDPTGQFFVVDNAQVLPIGAGMVPPFVPYGALARDAAGVLYLGSAGLVGRWSAPQSALVDWAGRTSPDSLDDPLPRQGPGESVGFDHPVMNLSVIGDKAFATQADSAGLAVIDLASGSVSLSQLPNAADIAAILPGPAGTYYVATRSSCAVLHVYSDGTPAETLFPGRQSCVQRAGGDPFNPANRNWATVGLAAARGRLFMVADDGGGIVSIAPSQPSSFVTLPLSSAYNPQSAAASGIGIATGSDSQLYVASGGFIARVDPAQGGGTPIAMGGARVAADQAGHLFTTFGDSVLRIDIDTGASTRIIGNAQTTGVAVGPLPGSLSGPQAIAVTSSGDLLIGNSGELVVLRAHLQ